jgi:gliding motility-associated-like protein
LASDPRIRNPIVIPLDSTLFKVTLTDQNGCKNMDTIMVGVLKKPHGHAGPDQTLDYLLETKLNAVFDYSFEVGRWSLLSGSGVITDISDPKTLVKSLSLKLNEFLWTVTNHICPSTIDTVKIFVNDFLIPTLITPNLDGSNDYFELRGLATLGKTELIIFDRRGALVFKNLNYDNKWNGVDYNDNPLPDDTYFYVLKSTNGKSLSGYIVIRR